MTSFVHDTLFRSPAGVAHHDNRPGAVRCVHPLVTLLEKLDAIARKFPTARPAETFVRHYEDAARIIAAEAGLPSLPDFPDVRALAAEMGHRTPRSNDPGFAPANVPRWHEVAAAFDAIGPMFWGGRLTLDAACGTIRAWLQRTFEGHARP